MNKSTNFCYIVIIIFAFREIIQTGSSFEQSKLKKHFKEKSDELQRVILFRPGRPIESSNSDQHQLKNPLSSRSSFIHSNHTKLKCEPKNHVMFAKVHKTGSSSVQNIFLRYGDDHDLFFAFPRKNNYIGHPSPFNRQMVYDLKSRYNVTYSMIVHHLRFNYEELQKVMPEDTIYVTILRDPLKLYESLFTYCDLGNELLGKKINLTDFANLYSDLLKGRNVTDDFKEDEKSSHLKKDKVPDKNQRVRARYGRNQMAFDLGFEPRYFDDAHIVKKFINELDSIFHLVLINEKMDESLILLKHLLCWSIEDVISFQHNRRSSLYTLKEPLPSKVDKIIRALNSADQLIYNHFYNKLNQMIQAFGVEKMALQVNELREKRAALYSKCVQSTDFMSNMVKNHWVNPTVLMLKINPNNDQDKLCTQLTMREISYTAKLRKKQKELLSRNIFKKKSKSELFFLCKVISFSP